MIKLERKIIKLIFFQLYFILFIIKFNKIYNIKQSILEMTYLIISLRIQTKDLYL